MCWLFGFYSFSISIGLVRSGIFCNDCAVFVFGIGLYHGLGTGFWAQRVPPRGGVS